MVVLAYPSKAVTFLLEPIGKYSWCFCENVHHRGGKFREEFIAKFDRQNPID
jgi:hypothetical protein